MNTKISEGAVEAAKRAMYFSANPDATEGEYIDDSNDPESAEVVHWLRISLAAALPHLYPQPAELADTDVLEIVARYVGKTSSAFRYIKQDLTTRYAAALDDALAATGKQQVGEIPTMDAGLAAWLTVRGLMPDADEDGCVEMDDVIAALNDHERQLAPEQQVGEVQGHARAHPETNYRSKFLDLLEEVIHAKKVMRSAGVDQADFPEMFAHFAARQPVGQEPYGWHLVASENGFGHQEHFTRSPVMTELVKAAMVGRVEITPLFDHPPAQAVDLGQFREAVNQWKLAAERVIRCKGHAMAEEKVKVRDEAVRLLALIDGGKAVQ